MSLPGVHLAAASGVSLVSSWKSLGPTPGVAG
jgi:hypothetical protein